MGDVASRKGREGKTEKGFLFGYVHYVKEGVVRKRELEIHSKTVASAVAFVARMTPDVIKWTDPHTWTPWLCVSLLYGVRSD